MNIKISDCSYLAASESGMLVGGAHGDSLCESIDDMSESNILEFSKILGWAVLCPHCNNNKNYRNENLKILEHYGGDEIWKNEISS